MIRHALTRRPVATAVAAILGAFLACLVIGRALYQADVIGAVPMGTQTAIYVGPCTVQPLQLSGTCRTERGQ
jgi:hypothetical protein